MGAPRARAVPDPVTKSGSAATVLDFAVGQILRDDTALGALPAVLERLVSTFGLRAAVAFQPAAGAAGQPAPEPPGPAPHPGSAAEAGLERPAGRRARPGEVRRHAAAPQARPEPRRARRRDRGGPRLRLSLRPAARLGPRAIRNGRRPRPPPVTPATAAPPATPGPAWEPGPQPSQCHNETVLTVSVPHCGGSCLGAV